MFGVEDFESLFVFERSIRYTRCRYYITRLVTKSNFIKEKEVILFCFPFDAFSLSINTAFHSDFHKKKNTTTPIT